MSSRSHHELLIVDGYNVLGATPRYEGLIDEHTDPEHFDTDPFVRAREALITDVAAFAQGRYDAVVVFDGAQNPDPTRNATHEAGIEIMFSRAGESADTVIERLVTEARVAGRPVSLVTSDNTVRATAGFGPGEVTRISSGLLVHEIERVDREVETVRGELKPQKMTVEDRISPEMRAKLWKMLGH